MRQERRHVEEEQQLRYDHDYTLVQRSLSGDESAWEILYRRAFPIAKRTVHKFDPQQILTDEDAEDIATEALLCCYQKREKFELRCLFSTWAGGFVRNLTLNYRAKHYRRLQKQEIIFYESLPVAVDPLYIVLRKERNFYMWLALEGMDEVDRTVFMWHDMGQCSKTQARQMTGLRRSDMEEAAQKAQRQYCCNFWNAYPG